MGCCSAALEISSCRNIGTALDVDQQELALLRSRLLQ